MSIHIRYCHAILHTHAGRVAFDYPFAPHPQHQHSHLRSAHLSSPLLIPPRSLFVASSSSSSATIRMELTGEQPTVITFHLKPSQLCYPLLSLPYLTLPCHTFISM